MFNIDTYVMIIESDNHITEIHHNYDRAYNHHIVHKLDI